VPVLGQEPVLHGLAQTTFSHIAILDIFQLSRTAPKIIFAAHSLIERHFCLDPSQFSLHAELEDHHWWFAARREIMHDLLRRYVPPGAGQLVVEVGCGTGGNLKYFSRDYRVMGVDLSADAVAYARQRVDCPVLQGDFAEQLAPYWSDIAAILLPDVLEHVDADADFLQRMIDSLRPGGILLVTVPAYQFLWSSHDEVLGHVRRYNPGRLKRLWHGQPVTQLFFSHFNSFLFPLIAGYRLLGFGKDEEDKSHLQETPVVMNRLLHAVFRSEKFWLRWLPLPWGNSLCAVLKKS